MKKLIVGSRDSKLAVAQTQIVIDMIKKANPNTEVELVTLKTTGDLILDKTLDKIGGKGLFVKELDRALELGEIDVAVHSLKDMPAEQNDDFPILAMLKRQDPRDAIVYSKGGPDGFERNVGTSSLRRQLQFSMLYNQAEYAFTRGNIHTRLKKLDDGLCSCLILAAAGLQRVNMQGRIGRYLSTDEMIPSAGQGILAVQGRKDIKILNSLKHECTQVQAMAERSFVGTLGGGCSAPVAAFAEICGEELKLSGFFRHEQTQECRVMHTVGTVSEAQKLGETLAERIMR